MLKKKEDGNGWYDAPLTVEDLIKELQNYNPKAIVKLHMSSYNFETGKNNATGDGYVLSNEDASGVTAHSFEGKMEFKKDEVWIYTDILPRLKSWGSF